LDTLRLKLEKLDTDKQGLHFFLVPKQLYWISVALSQWRLLDTFVCNLQLYFIK
jgi:hypothetical protein